ncbi:MAG: FHA domain-containing protein, partial [Acidobacteriota bacterium]|nr:FHA domain-containing protein [Acidobacteriota bacterium]
MISFPAGETVSSGTHFTEATFREVEAALDARQCPEGRLDLEFHDTRLTCLVHHGRPYLAGLLESRDYSRVPLVDFPLRARQLEGASWRLARTDLSEVMILGVHFCRRPVLQGSTRWIDIQHVLASLAADRSDAALAFERNGMRTLVFLHQGVPARIFFADQQDDPGEGSIADRLLIHAFDPAVAEGWLEVFTDLKLSADADAGRSLVELAQEAKPPPPVNLVVRLGDGREVTDRPFTPPVVSIGRDQRSDIFLDNLAVSRRHATIAWERGGFVVRDAGSANGTRLNGKQVNSAPVGPGDRIEVGKFEISLVEPQAAGDVSETM